jgi:four helix bundle protein
LDGWTVASRNRLAVFLIPSQAIGYAFFGDTTSNHGMMPFEKLSAWQCCHELFLVTYSVTSRFPKSELYGLTSQMRRAAFSAAANIAEGSAKRGPREFRRYLDITLGSLAEMAYAIRAVSDLGLLSVEESGRLSALRTRAGQVTWGLYRRVKRLAESTH